MQYFKLGENEVSRVVQGCMRIASKSEKEIDEFVEAAFEGGINFFDHADIYGRGGCEEVFGRFLSRNPGFRDKIYIQTKCGIKPGISFDFTYEHIISSVDKSLARLGTDRIDYLLLHRPDTLFEPEEVARAFSELREKGKVLHFGVSNQHPMQMELLRKYMGDIPLVANQLQMSVAHCPMIDYGINVNIINDFSANRDGGVLEYCRLNDITIQPWSPFQYGFMEGAFIGNERFAALNEKLDEVSARYGVTSTGMAIAWLLRHPAKLQPVIGTTTPSRIKEVCHASDVVITHDEWYELYKSAGKKLP
ncbi:MAG: aldo/keto reductase [Clostridia bacterium]|nr:aldo/keto reductase [Clostridia bacterium]